MGSHHDEIGLPGGRFRTRGPVALAFLALGGDALEERRHRSLAVEK